MTNILFQILGRLATDVRPSNYSNIHVYGKCPTHNIQPSQCWIWVAITFSWAHFTNQKNWYCLSVEASQPISSSWLSQFRLYRRMLMNITQCSRCSNRNEQSSSQHFVPFGNQFHQDSPWHALGELSLTWPLSQSTLQFDMLDQPLLQILLSSFLMARHPSEWRRLERPHGTGRWVYWSNYKDIWPPWAKSRLWSSIEQ